jgi:uncharacterized OB-fold protein
VASWQYGALPVPAGFVGEIESDADSILFWNGLKAGELKVQQCEVCGTHRFPFGPFCLNCGDRALSVLALTSRPYLYSWIVVTRATHPSVAVPYAVGIAQFVEGVRIPGVLEVLDEVTDVGVGVPLEVRIHQGDRPFVVFTVQKSNDC